MSGKSVCGASHHLGLGLGTTGRSLMQENFSFGLLKFVGFLWALWFSFTIH